MITMTNKKTRIGFRISEEFKKEIEKFANKESVTLTNFVISAIQDKIRSIKHPELFNRPLGQNEKIREEIQDLKNLIKTQNLELLKLQEEERKYTKKIPKERYNSLVEKAVLDQFNSVLYQNGDFPKTVKHIHERALKNGYNLEFDDIYNYVIHSEKLKRVRLVGRNIDGFILRKEEDPNEQ